MDYTNLLYNLYVSLTGHFIFNDFYSYNKNAFFCHFYILDKNLNFSIYEKKLKDIFNFKFDSNIIYEKLYNKYKEEKNENKINISLLEISNSNNFHYNNYQNNDIKIVKYKDVNADNTDIVSFETYKKELNRWFDENSKSKNDINIIIL